MWAVVRATAIRNDDDSIKYWLGYGSDELTRMGVENIHPEEDLPYILDEFKALARGEKGLAENIPCLHKDGTKRYWMSRLP